MPEEKKLSDFDTSMGEGSIQLADFEWYDPAQAPYRVSGFAWQHGNEQYYRMPIDRKHLLPEAVEYLSHHTAGGQIAFRSNAKRLAIRVRLKEPADMRHMPATGQCGFDLYIGEPGQRHFYNVTKYDIKKDSYALELFNQEEAEEREFLLNFPLYQGVVTVEIGLNFGAEVKAPSAFADDKRIVIYGTSITQGGCCSRPGMAYTNILSRKLNREVVNLGYSGSGQGEPIMAELISELDRVGLFVLDYEANSYNLYIGNTLPKFIEILKEHQPEVPVLVISKIAYAGEYTFEERKNKRLALLEVQKKIVSEAQEKYGKVHFLDGGALLKDSIDECTVDGSHPTDLGFLQMAKGIHTEIERCINLYY